jgi:radical SAM-linked protein
VRRSGVPIAYSQGFSPHPKISYASAAPTGVASEAEYLEIGLQAPMDPADVRAALDAALSPGLDVVDAVEADGESLADRIDASSFRVELPDLDPDRLAAAVAAFLAADEVIVDKITKTGRRSLDVRAAVVTADAFDVARTPHAADAVRCAILDLVVRQVTPSVRPDDVLAGLRVVADLEPPVAPKATRLAQGRLTAQGEIVDPLVAGDRPVIGGPSE